MKYIKLFLITVFSFFIILVYLFIPNKIVVSSVSYVHQPGNIVTNSFMSIQYWDKWMPHDSINDHTFVLKQGKLEVHESFLSAVKCLYTLNEMSGPVTYSAIDAGGDSTMIRYEANINNKFISPMKRIHNYFDSKKMKLQLDITLEAAKKFYTKRENNKVDTAQ
ncbi:MAG: hypothetical protein EB092_04735 [Chitinophagia bacterium]|jgi:hypothetical protein|nr:hypothetical protein [Chitinophagia bacterium]NCA29124.1 hypothetical protein [Chitinophagia bacterium]NDD16296.1 hypothetical protein [Chitinophagia bacterium]